MNKLNFVVKTFLISYFLFFCSSVISLDFLMRAMTDFNFIGIYFDSVNLLRFSLCIFPVPLLITFVVYRKKFK